MRFQCRAVFHLRLPEETINHSGGSRKRKITLEIVDPEIMIEKKKLFERDMEREEGDNLIFVKGLLPDIKSLPQWPKRPLQFRSS
jgi:hypothetical protein